MANASSGPSDTSPARPADDRLESWKEIAAYLKRDVSTVQRWEKKEGLPVHRHVHDKLGSVYAFRAELDDWRRNGHPVESDVAANAPVVRHSSWRRAVSSAAAVIVGGLLVGLAVWRFWPVPAPQTAARFEYLLPEGQQFRNTGRPIVAISADGRHFVYNATGGLYLRSMGELEARLVPGTADPLSSVVFSPDGQSLAYFDIQSDEIKRIALSGATPMTICAATNPFGISWAADDTILFGQRAGVMRVAASGGTPVLAIPVKEGEAVYGPQLLPDGDSVLFSTTMGTGPTRWDQAHVVAQSLSSGARTVLLKGRDAHYLPTGHITYAVRDAAFVVRFDAHRLRTSGDAVPIVHGIQQSAGSVSGATHYAVSDRGTLLYVPDIAAVSRALVWVNRNGTVAGPVASIPPGIYERPALSPDGARLLVDRDDDLWIYDLASGRSTRLTSDGCSEWGVWHPAGSHVAYSSCTKGSVEAWMKPSDGTGEPQQLTNLGGQVHVNSWSPDGSTLAVHHHSGQTPTRILMLSLDSADAKPRLFYGGSASAAGNPDFSPDGRYVAYQSSESGAQEIYIRPYSGAGGHKPVSVGGGREHRWTKAGELFYRSRNGDRMMTVAVTTEPTLKVGIPVQLFEGAYYSNPSTVSPQYDVTSDGQRIVIVKPVASADALAARPRVVVVLNALTN